MDCRLQTVDYRLAKKHGLKYNMQTNYRLGAEHRLQVSLRSKRFRRVWEQRRTEERGFPYFACAENGARAKKRTVGVGEGKEGTACGQTPGF